MRPPPPFAFPRPPFFLLLLRSRQSTTHAYTSPRVFAPFFRFSSLKTGRGGAGAARLKHRFQRGRPGMARRIPQQGGQRTPQATVESSVRAGRPFAGRSGPDHGRIMVLPQTNFFVSFTLRAFFSFRFAAQQTKLNYSPRPLLTSHHTLEHQPQVHALRPRTIVFGFGKTALV